MKWQPHYATGHPEIDQQHMMLFESSDQFRQTLEAGEGRKTYDLFLEFLAAYAEAHFSVEERCMMANKCPVAEQNKHEHSLFLKLVQKEQARFATDGFTRASAEAMLDMVDGWLDSHIGRVDIMLRDATERG